MLIFRPVFLFSPYRVMTAASPASHPYSSARHPQPRHVSPFHGITWSREGWRLFIQKPVIWVIISAIFTVMLIVLWLIPIVGQTILLIGFPIMVAGMVSGCDAQAKGESLR